MGHGCFMAILVFRAASGNSLCTFQQVVHSHDLNPASFLVLQPLRVALFRITGFSGMIAFEVLDESVLHHFP